jgi:hypothetical protein
VDELYALIEKNEGLKQKIKIIGIGAGNNDMEIKLYRDSFKVPFPLFTDDDFTIHKKLGQVKTPYFMVVQINGDGSHKVLYSKVGAFKEADAFLKHIMDLSGLK